MNCLVLTIITLCLKFDVSYSWIKWTKDGVTYSGGTTYNMKTLCPTQSSTNLYQPYACHPTNQGIKKLDASDVSPFCDEYYKADSIKQKQFGFGHGVTDDQACGKCGQLRVLRQDGTYNYMTVMKVDSTTTSMEVGTVEIDYLLEGTGEPKGNRLNFEYRIVGDYDCSVSFDNGSTRYTYNNENKGLALSEIILIMHYQVLCGIQEM